MEEANPELESFRQKWRAEVSARSKPGGAHKESQASTSKPARRPPAAPRITTDKDVVEEEYTEPQPYHDLGQSSGLGGIEDGESSKNDSAEPHSALEHYEKAVERESQGSLGDSLNLYRKAFKVSVSDYRVRLLLTCL
jgi:F-box protein 9